VLIINDVIFWFGVQPTRHEKFIFDGFFEKGGDSVFFLLKTNWIL